MCRQCAGFSYMDMELLNVYGRAIPHYIIPIKGDGSCLFRALSFVMFNTQHMANIVRKEIISHVVTHWAQFAIMSHDHRGNNYLNAAAYWNDMSQPYTYGGLCELMAAGQIYPYTFEVYRNGEIYTRAGDHGFPVRRLRFTDDLSSGHFDAYVIKANVQQAKHSSVGALMHNNA
ncbi:uncharacterized protein LOC115627605 isoform X2 [Scaptodrosophila lebanonensis]|uniref:Uncharacterized protein LOC115627605 isoform X2 n=1 Tax=Drosophila lebanonensis TaxID=7225 RepID=A0A6J2TSZ7_DROLE|nr:uncharacterized protein LOC115627605 isoform X2 [Scaptodrosophila lebanonensis]